VRVAVCGAGVAGLSVAWRLAKAGIETHVFDAGAPGAGATWASAGMLTPWQYDRPSPLQSACEDALMLWPEFHQHLQDQSGHAVPLDMHGMIRAAFDDIEAQALKNRAAALSERGVRVEGLKTAPGFLNKDMRLAVHFPDEGAVDNRVLGPALAAAAASAGAHIHAGERIVRILIAVDKVLGVETSARRLACDTVLVAAGAWSGRIEGLPPHARPPVVPRKGQIITLRTGPDERPFSPMLSTQGIYAVPRAGGGVVAGATVEDTGFEAQVDAEAIAGLAMRAKRLMANAADWTVMEAWAGLRPGTPDGMPVLGPTPIEGLHLATGQFRDGILLAPWIADWVSAAIAGAETPERLKPFSIQRFQGETRP
jgi:glycine oxidase